MTGDYYPYPWWVWAVPATVTVPYQKDAIGGFTWTYAPPVTQPDVKEQPAMHAEHLRTLVNELRPYLTPENVSMLLHLLGEAALDALSKARKEHKNDVAPFDREACAALIEHVAESFANPTTEWSRGALYGFKQAAATVRAGK